MYGSQRLTEGRDKGGGRTDIYTVLYVKQIANKDLLYSTGNSTQFSAMIYMEKKSEKKCMYMYV